MPTNLTLFGPPVYARAWTAATLLALTAGCADAGAPAPLPPSASNGESAASAESTTAAAGLDPAWQRAQSSGDALDLAALAARVGPLALAEQLGHPALGPVARGALEHSADGDQALGALASAALRPGADREATLTTLLVVLSRPGALGERLDPEEDQRGVQALQTLASDTSASRTERAAAISALRRLAQVGLTSPEQIPADLDAP